MRAANFCPGREGWWAIIRVVFAVPTNRKCSADKALSQIARGGIGRIVDQKCDVWGFVDNYSAMNLEKQNLEKHDSKKARCAKPRRIVRALECVERAWRPRCQRAKGAKELAPPREAAGPIIHDGFG